MTWQAEVTVQDLIWENTPAVCLHCDCLYWRKMELGQSVSQCVVLMAVVTGVATPGGRIRGSSQRRGHTLAFRIRTLALCFKSEREGEGEREREAG